MKKDISVGMSDGQMLGLLVFFLSLWALAGVKAIFKKAVRLLPVAVFVLVLR